MLLSHTKVKTDSLGVTDVKITVGFRRETCLYTASVLAVGQVFLNHLFNKVQTLFLAVFSYSILYHF